MGRTPLLLLLLLWLTAPDYLTAFLHVAPAPARPRRAGVRDPDARARRCADGGTSSTAAAAAAAAALAVPAPLATLPALGRDLVRTRPLAAAVIAGAARACVADGLAQRRDLCHVRFDARRHAAMVLYGGVVLGAACEVMYNGVFPRLFGPEVAAAGRLARAVKITLFVSPRDGSGQ